MRPPSTVQEYISNLSMDLMGHALELIQHKAFPVYKRNIGLRKPPFAHGEFGPCAIASLLLPSGLDYHLSRLKYLRDEGRDTKHFNWTSDDSLATKIDRLLVKGSEKRLKKQLIEFTIMRDSVAHPKLYFITQLMRLDYSFTEQKPTLCTGARHREKAVKHKFKHSEKTKSLCLPLVPTWISYVDIVVCVLVLTRFLNLLEEKHGSDGWLGGFLTRDDPPGFFPNRGDHSKNWRTIPIEEWAQAFFNSLAQDDRQGVQKRLGADVTEYIRKR